MRSVQAVSAGRGLLCFILGLLGVLPLVVLTPPLQVVDEPQHFLRAYQLSELQLTAAMYQGEKRATLPASLEAKAVLPSSLIETIESFLGTREVYNDRPVSPQPLRRTFSALDTPLDPERREPLSLVTIAKTPPAYLPQAGAIAVGRWLGAGPLLLLYLGRLANALVAVAILTRAVRLMPAGREMAMLFGLLPMAIYLYASMSPDTSVITTVFSLLPWRCASYPVVIYIAFDAISSAGLYLRWPLFWRRQGRAALRRSANNLAGPEWPWGKGVSRRAGSRRLKIVDDFDRTGNAAKSNAGALSMVWSTGFLSGIIIQPSL